LWYRTGKFLILEEKTTSVSLMLTSMALALHKHRYDWGKENCHAGRGGVFLEKEIIVSRLNTSRKCNCIKVAIKNF
jgi:hypothetical protein